MTPRRSRRLADVGQATGSGSRSNATTTARRSAAPPPAGWEQADLADCQRRGHRLDVLALHHRLVVHSLDRSHPQLGARPADSGADGCDRHPPGVLALVVRCQDRCRPGLAVDGDQTDRPHQFALKASGRHRPPTRRAQGPGPSRRAEDLGVVVDGCLLRRPGHQGHQGHQHLRAAQSGSAGEAAEARQYVDWYLETDLSDRGHIAQRMRRAAATPLPGGHVPSEADIPPGARALSSEGSGGGTGRAVPRTVR